MKALSAMALPPECFDEYEQLKARKMKEVTEEDQAVLDAVKEAQQPLTPGQALLWKNFFRVKGRQGVYIMLGKINRAGMCCMERMFRMEERYTVKAMDLVNLGDLVFTTYVSNDDLSMLEVYDNLFAWGLDNPEVELGDVWMDNPSRYMKIAVPMYDPDLFKRSHMKMVVAWYEEIRARTTEMKTKAEEYESAEDTQENKEDENA